MRSDLSSPRPQLVEILFGAYRRKILGLLLLRPDETFYVRELKLLTDAGLLQRTTAGNQVRYQANRECPIYAELAGSFRKTAGLADVLRELLTPLQNEIALALVFGSMAQGKARSTSDIDLLVIGSASFADVVEACHAGTARLGRDVNPVVMAKATFRTKHRQRDRFVSRIATEPKIFLIGDASEFGKLAEDRPA